jgi:hypothetical protein
VTLVAATLAVAMLVNIVRGHDPFAFATRSWRWPAVPFLCALVQFANGLTSLPLQRLFTVSSQVVVVAWLAIQIRHQRDIHSNTNRSLGLLLGGAALNTIAIIRYGGMPVSARALEAIGAAAGRDVTHGQLGKHLLMRDYATFGWLGDILPLPLPVVRSVISLGDIAMAGGVFFLVIGSRGAPQSEPNPLGGSIHRV